MRAPDFGKLPYDAVVGNFDHGSVVKGSSLAAAQIPSEIPGAPKPRFETPPPPRTADQQREQLQKYSVNSGNKDPKY